MEPDYQLDGFTSIICNSLVKNKKALEKIKPEIITASDPIFHAGCSSYAGIFRTHLVETMDCYSSFFVVPMRDYGIYMANLPERFHDKIIGIPVKTEHVPNLDIDKSFHVTSTGNILTLILLPLACTLFNEIHIAGFDGSPLQQKDYFWKHDPASQLNDQMAMIQQAHPAFFEIDYNEYYLEHIETTEKWIRQANKINISIINRMPSYIPILKEIQSVNL